MDLDDTQVAGYREHATPMVSKYWKSELLFMWMHKLFLLIHVDTKCVEVCTVTEAGCATISHHWQCKEI